MFYPKCYAKVLFMGVFSLLIMSVIGCDRQPQQADEIRIGLITYLEASKAKNPGLMEAVGLPNLHAAELAVKEINSAGGFEIGGKKAKVRLFVEDIAMAPEPALAAAQKLINQEQVVALVGPQMSPEAIPVGKLAEEAHIPMISPASTNPDTTADKRYVFRACWVDDDQAKALARFARDNLGVQRAAILYRVTDVQIRNLAQIFQQIFEDLGGEVVALETFLVEEKQDFRPQLERIKASGTEVLFVPAGPPMVALIVPQASQLGLRIPVLGDDRWGALGALLHPFIPELEGTFHADHWHPDFESEQSQAFVKTFRHAYPQTFLYYGAALTYDAFGLIFSAIRHQKKADQDSIRNGLYSMGPYTGVTGTIEYRDSGDPVKSVFIMQIQEDKRVFYKLVNP